MAPLFLTPEVIGNPKKLSYHNSLEAACQGADVIIALIEWSQVVSFDYNLVRDVKKPQWFIDARNQFSRTTLEKAGYTYLGIGK